jgi:hypothetical protein
MVPSQPFSTKRFLADDYQSAVSPEPVFTNGLK